MSEKEFRSFLNLLMCSDPWPTGAGKDHVHMVDFANKLAQQRGYTTWVNAYHASAITQPIPNLNRCEHGVHRSEYCATCEGSMSGDGVLS